MEANVLRGCETWAAAAEGGWTRRNRAIVAVGCDAGYRAFNQMFPTRPDLDTEELREAISWYAVGGGHFRLRMRDDLHDAVRDTLESGGLVRHGGIPTMTFVGHLPPAKDTGLRIAPVTDARTLDDHVRVVAEAFEWTTGDLGRVFGPRLIDEQAWAAWVGYEDGVAVSSSQLVIHERVAGLYYVGTVKEARGKGYGDAITRAAIREGLVRGCDLVCLQASSLGRPVYARLGFEVGGEYVTYVPSENA